MRNLLIFLVFPISDALAQGKTPFGEIEKANFSFPHLKLGSIIPEGYTIADIPKSTKINLPEKSGSFKFMVQKDNEKQLSIISRLRINQPVFSKEFYPFLWKFFDMVAEKQNEQVVLKKVP